MEGIVEKPSVNLDLGGQGINFVERRSDNVDLGKSIYEVLPPEIDKKIKEVDHTELGEGSESFLVFKKPLENITPIEDGAGNKLIDKKISFLTIAVDRNTDTPSFKKLTFTIYEIEDISTLSDRRLLEKFQQILNDENSKNKKQCAYEFHEDYEIISFGDNKINNKQKIESGLNRALTKDESITIEDIDSQEFNQFIAANEQKIAA